MKKRIRNRLQSQAFAGCKNLKKITVKTPYLTKKSVGAKAFKGIYTKATIKVPKKQKKAYQSLFKAKGTGKKVKIKYQEPVFNRSVFLIRKHKMPYTK